jgi:hypothetical protein
MKKLAAHNVGKRRKTKALSMRQREKNKINTNFYSSLLRNFASSRFRPTRARKMSEEWPKSTDYDSNWYIINLTLFKEKLKIYGC